MSQNPTNARRNEEALTALFIIVALGFGSLFAVAKTVGNRFIGPTLQKDERGSEVDREPEETKEPRRINTDSDGTNLIQNDHVRMEDDKDAPVEFARSQTLTPQVTIPLSINGTFQPIQAEAHLLSSQRNRDREQGLEAIRAWEEATTIRIQREKVKRLERLPSLDQRENGWTQGLEAVFAWEQSTTSRFQQERARRLERLSSLDQQEINQEQGREAVHAWEQVTMREVSRKKGVEAVSTWERATSRRSR